MQSNQVLTGLIKGLKRQGKNLSSNEQPISEEDHKKLYERCVFSPDTTETLQNKVMYVLIAQFGRRDREGLHTLNKDAFVLKNDVRGRKYVTLKFNEADKTHQGLDFREIVKEPRKYANHDEYCSLFSFEKY